MEALKSRWFTQLIKEEGGVGMQVGLTVKPVLSPALNILSFKFHPLVLLGLLVVELSAF